MAFDFSEPQLGGSGRGWFNDARAPLVSITKGNGKNSDDWVPKTRKDLTELAEEDGISMPRNKDATFNLGSVGNTLEAQVIKGNAVRAGKDAKYVILSEDMSEAFRKGKGITSAGKAFDTKAFWLDWLKTYATGDNKQTIKLSKAQLKNSFPTEFKVLFPNEANAE